MLDVIFLGQAALACWLAFAGSQQAVSSTTLQGVIRDQTGAVLPGATVELDTDAGAVVASTQTDAKGEFRFNGVAPGGYQIHARFEGFRPSTSSLRVVARRAPPFQAIVLDLAAVSQDVTVHEGDPVIAATAAANRDAVTIDDQALRNLPVFDRDVVGTLSRFLDDSALGTGGVTLVVDGMEAQSVGVSPSAIQQIKVNSDPYAAEFSRPGRGRIEVITKAGSDAYHGSFNFTFRDDSLNARDPFAVTKPPDQRRIYEGVLGGPVGDGKTTSFLVTAERREQDLQAIIYAAGPDGLVTGNVATPTRTTQMSASLNHQQGAHNTLSVRFTSEVSNDKNQGVGGTTLAEAASDVHGDEEQVVVGARTILTDHLLSEFRILAGREISSTASLNPALRIVVLDAFTAGGAQADQSTSEYHIQSTEKLTYIRGKQLFTGGFEIPDFSRRGYDDQTNAAGTYTFATLADYEAGRPQSFVQQRGNGNLVFLQKVFGAFVQDQIMVSNRFSVTPGLRYDWQNIFTDNDNFAPRLSAAWALNPKTAIRGGAGVFYDRAGDSSIHEVLRSRANLQQRYIILDPSYPDPLTGPAAAATPPSIVTLAPGIRTPYTVQYGVGVERQLHKTATLAINYLGSNGIDLFRSRDVNAPLPPLYLARPNPNVGQIREIESNGRQTTRSLQVVARGRFVKWIQGTAQYTLASAWNDTAGINAFPANNYDLASEWGRADFDRRHQFEGLLQLKGNDWTTFGVAVSLKSGRPYSLLTGTDDFNTGQTNARPAGVARNTLDGPGYADVDLRWSREFALAKPAKPGDAPTVTIGVDAFNLLNQVNYVAFIGNLSSPFFGEAVAAQPPRRIQLSGEFRF